MINCKNTYRSQRGASLIELLVGLTVGLMLLTALASMFESSSRALEEVDKSARQFETGRYAIDLLSEELNHAGYFGEIWSSTNEKNSGQINPCSKNLNEMGWIEATTAGGAVGLPFGVQGYSEQQAAGLDCLKDRKAGTSVFSVVRLEYVKISPSSGPASNPPVVPGDIYIQVSNCKSDDAPFIASAAGSSGNSAIFVLRQNLPIAPAIGGFLECGYVAALRKLVTHTYYVASCNECELGGDGVPTLKRIELQGDSFAIIPMAEGIEDMVLAYGFDTKNLAGDISELDGIPDEYRLGVSGVALANNNNWANVVAAKLHILTRATDKSSGYVDAKKYDMGLSGSRGPFGDAYKRKTYSSVVRLNNLAVKKAAQ